jgi:serine/threonine protein kinase
MNPQTIISDERNLPPPYHWTSPADLLAALGKARLIKRKRARRLAERWSRGDGEDFLSHLVERGLLTRYQANCIQAGYLRQLCLGPYRILDHLGSGGTGEVYKAWHLLMKRVVALKTVRSRSQGGQGSGLFSVDATPGTREKQVIASFRQEMEILARLHHPHIVLAHEAIPIRGQLILVMEYVEGINLEALVLGQGPLPIPLACEAIRQGGLALAYLLEQGLIHRDIKPANFLAACPGATPASESNPADLRLKLLDMGLARPLSHPAEEDYLEGTLDFLAPERGHFPCPLDIRSDLYSLGCTFYFLLTGQVPYPGGNWTSKILRHQLETPVPIPELRPDVPPHVVAVVERLMARDKENRFPSPQALVATLEGLGSPAPLGPESPSSLSCPPPRQAPRTPIPFRWVAATLLALAVLAGALAGGSKQWLDQTGTQANPASSSPKQERVENARFRLEQGGGPFPSLAKAIRAARDGETILIEGNTLIALRPIRWEGKALTLKAASGCRPRLVWAGNTSGGAEDWWKPLLSTDRDLVLEGIDLGRAEEPSVERGPLVCVQGSALSLRSCRLTQPGDAPAVLLRGGTTLTMEECTVKAQSVGVSAEVAGPCNLHLERNTFDLPPSGLALSLWAGERESKPVALHLVANTLKAGRILGLQGLHAPVQCQAQGNHFEFQQELVSRISYRGPGDRRSALRWQGQENRFVGSKAWLPEE